MKKLLIPKVNVNDELIIKKEDVVRNDIPVKECFPEIKVKIIQVGDQYCAVNVETGKAVKLEEKYEFLSIFGLLFTMGKEYNVYQEN